jgi:hypothetical protein
MAIKLKNPIAKSKHFIIFSVYSGCDLKPQENHMNYSEALSFAFQDEQWAKKIAIGGLFTFIAVFSGILFFFGFLALGYYIGVLRNVMSGESKPLPEWKNWGKFIADGLLGCIIFLAYFLVIGGITALLIVQVATEPGFQDFERVLLIVSISLVALFSLTILTNIGLVQFAATNDFGAAFNLAEIFRSLRNDFANYLTIVIFSAILNCILFLVGIAIFSPFTNFWGLVVQAHLFGQSAKSVHAPSAAVQSV